MATTPQAPWQTPGYFDAQAINRQREMAKILTQQGQNQPQGQMVSGRFVAPTFGQYLAPALATYVGQQKLEKADESEKALAQKLATQNAEQWGQYSQLMAGDQGVAPVQGPTPEGANLSDTVKARAPRAPDRAGAINYALQSNNPELRALALEKLKGQKLGEGETYQEFDLGTGQHQTIAQGGPKLTNDQRDYQTAVQQGFKGSLFDYQQKLKQAGATNVNLSTEKSYGQAFGGKIAEQDAGKYENALGAPKRVADADQTLDLINKGAITGFGADFKLNAARALGVSGANNAELIKNTELLVSNRGQAVLSNIKTSGLGAGQGFTDKDRIFLENVVGGRIALSAGTLKELAMLEKRAAIATATQWNSRYDKMPEDVRRATGVHKIEFGAAPPAAPPAPGAPGAANPAPKPNANPSIISPEVANQYGVPLPK